MHTEDERKFLMWAEFSRFVVMMEIIAMDGNGFQFQIDQEARDQAYWMGTVYIGDWVRQQAEWRGAVGPAEWVNIHKRSVDQIADAIREVARRWMSGDCIPITASCRGDQVEYDRFGPVQRSIASWRESVELRKARL